MRQNLRPNVSEAETSKRFQLMFPVSKPPESRSGPLVINLQVSHHDRGSRPASGSTQLQ